MDIATIVGLLGAFGLIFMAIDDIGAFIDTPSMLIVVAGSGCRLYMWCAYTHRHGNAHLSMQLICYTTTGFYTHMHNHTCIIVHTHMRTCADTHVPIQPCSVGLTHSATYSANQPLTHTSTHTCRTLVVCIVRVYA